MPFEETKMGYPAPKHPLGDRLNGWIAVFVLVLVIASLVPSIIVKRHELSEAYILAGALIALVVVVGIAIASYRWWHFRSEKRLPTWISTNPDGTPRPKKD